MFFAVTMFEIESIHYEFVEDDAVSEMGLGRPVVCHVPIEDGKEFNKVEDALKYASFRLGYDIRPEQWGNLNQDTTQVSMYCTDLTVDGMFRQISFGELGVGSDTWNKWERGQVALYGMTITVNIKSKGKTK